MNLFRGVCSCPRGDCALTQDPPSNTDARDTNTRDSILDDSTTPNPLIDVDTSKRVRIFLPPGISCLILCDLAPFIALGVLGQICTILCSVRKGCPVFTYEYKLPSLPSTLGGWVTLVSIGITIAASTYGVAKVRENGFIQWFLLNRERYPTKPTGYGIPPPPLCCTEE